MSFEGRTAIVSGGSRGIGKAIAGGLAAAGCRVAVLDVLEDEARRTAEELGQDHLAVACDVSSSDSVKSAVGQVVETFGKVDILVNNAGITRDNLLMRLPEEDWDRVLEINLKGAFLLTKAVARPMMKARAGSIVNVASVIGLIGNAGQANYAASKAGLIALTRSTAKELAGRGIRVNAVAPGYIETAMTKELPEDVLKAMLAQIPAGRAGQPEDVARAVLFLAGDDAAYVTGQVLVVDGGMVMA
jgi:3-oxoacyl-[acyl-carrier protein] reductase